jgi:hypothetical protein
MPQVITAQRDETQARELLEQAARIADSLERDGRQWSLVFPEAVRLLAGTPFIAPDPIAPAPLTMAVPGLTRARG